MTLFRLNLFGNQKHPKCHDDNLQIGVTCFDKVELYMILVLKLLTGTKAAAAEDRSPREVSEEDH